MTTRDLPGIGASIRIGWAAKARERSELSAAIRDSFTPTAGRKVNWVTVGPMATSPISTSIPKFESVRLMIVALALMSPVTASSWSSFNKSAGGRFHLPGLRFLMTNSLSVIGSAAAGLAIGVIAGLKSGLAGTISLFFLITTSAAGASFSLGLSKPPI